MSHMSPRGRHRAPSRLSNLSTTARVSAAVAVTSGLVAAVGAPANAAQGVASLDTRSTTTQAATASRAVTLTTPGAASGAATAAVAASRVQLPEMVRAQTLVIKTPTVSRSAVRPQARVSRAAAPQSTTAAPKTAARAAARPAAARHAAPARARDAAPQPVASRGDAPVSGRGATVVAIAKRYIGTPYVYAGSSPAGFDCSGFTSYVFRQVGISLPHSAAAQRAMTTPVSNPQPGDLAFYGGSHVMIYVGNGMVIDSAKPGTTVSIRKPGNATFGRLR